MINMEPQRGQLGHGDLVQYNVPVVVKGLAGLVITGGAHALDIHLLCVAP